MNRLLLSCIPFLIFIVLSKAANPENAPTLEAASPLTDTIAPLVFCPPNLFVTLAPMHCDSVLQYVVTSEDDQGTVIQIQLTGLPSDATFPIGVTTNTYLATDLAGNTATCSFLVTVTEPPILPLLCKDQDTIYLDQNCAKTIRPFDLLEGGPYGCEQSYKTEVDKTLPLGNGPWVPAVFGSADLNKAYLVRVTDTRNLNSCWSNVLIKDNLPPVLTCQTISVPCAVPLEQLTPVFLRDSFGIQTAYPLVIDGCSGSMVTLLHLDVLQNLPCTDTSTLSGIIQRIWTATDGNGNTESCVQTIRRERSLANVQVPTDKTTQCNNPNFSLTANGVPFVSFHNHRYEVMPASYCNFDWNYFDTIQSANCAGNYTVNRTWKIYDACLPLSATNPKIKVQHLEVHDTKKPVFQCPADMLVTVADSLCHGAVDLPDVYLTDNCSAITDIQAFWSDSSLTKMLAGSISFETDSSGTDTLAVFGIVTRFPVGTNTVLYVATDECGNAGECSFNLTVANTTPPTAKCDSLLVVGLPTSGYLSMPAVVPDNGSTDDCSPVVFKAKLSEINGCSTQLTFSDTIHICCRNAGDTLRGTLRVYDIAVPFGTVADSFGTGHFKDCTFKVRVAGSNPPSCTAPANITINCEAFDPTLVSYGGILTKSCSVDSVQALVQWGSFDTLCNRGTVTRQFKVFNSIGLMGQCSQKIVVNYNQEYFIHFPDDILVTTCDTSNLYGEPTFFGKDCELLNVTFEDATFTVIPDACFKIERLWKIINWCTYDPGLPLLNIPNPNPNPTTNHPDNLPGPVVSPVQTSGDPWKSTIVKINPTDALATNYSMFYDKNANGYQYKQIIKFLDNTAPSVENCAASANPILDQTQNDPLLWNAPYWNDPMLGISDLCEAPSDIKVTASDACKGANISFDYILYLDLDNNGILETVVNSTALPPSNTVMFGNIAGGGVAQEFDFRPVPADQKYRFAKQTVVNGNKSTAYVRFNTTFSPGVLVEPQLPYGTHRIKWTIQDGCGNQTVCERSFTIKDGKPPTIVCLPSLSVNLPPAGYFDLFNTDLVQFGEDNCTPSNLLAYAIRKADTGAGFPTDSTGAPVNKVTYTCNELGTQFVEVWARDAAGNADSCRTSVIVQDNGNYCMGSPAPGISGYVKTELNEGVAGVEIGLNTNSPFFPPFPFNNTLVTDTAGYFEFPGSFALSSSTTLNAMYDLNPLNGVTTYDLVLISKHILGIEPLGSPYKIIAADANKSGSLTTFDIVEFRKLILGIYQELPNNTSWRFVQKAYVFPNPLNPFQPAFPQEIPATDLVLPGITDDFVGVKIGDVNNTAVAHALAPPDERSAGVLHFKVSSKGRETVPSGSVFDVTFTAKEVMEGCQFTLNTKGLEVLDIVPGENMTREHFALFPDKNALTVAWEKGGLADFTLKCRATDSGVLAEMFSLGNQITRSEAYQENTNKQTERFDLGLQFSEDQSFELFQNNPNPFTGATDISFSLPEGSVATLKIYDVQGRMLFTQTGNYTAGVHTIHLEKSAIQTVGLLYYQLETETNSAVKKMIRI